MLNHRADAKTKRGEKENVFLGAADFPLEQNSKGQWWGKKNNKIKETQKIVRKGPVDFLKELLTSSQTSPPS